MPKPLFFSINLRCPNCRNSGSYIDTESETVVCDFCVYTFSKKNNHDNRPDNNSAHKMAKKRLMESINNVNK